VGSILLVEHSATWQATLDDAGHDTLSAGGMREALPLIRDGGIDVVVIDSLDPRAGVAELARGMAALPDAPPIVLISSSPHAPELSARIGVATFLANPCDAADLLTAIERLIGPAPDFEDEPTFARNFSA
jgi:DNA-binding NtrC family response regulator